MAEQNILSFVGVAQIGYHIMNVKQKKWDGLTEKRAGRMARMTV
jgi:hypothetical protein